MVMFKFKNEASKPIKERSYVYDLHYHVVWVTKYRVHAFNTDKVVNALKDKLLEIAKDNGYTIEAMEIMPNHVHLLISAKPKVSVTVMVKKLKGITGKWLFQAFPDEMRKYFWHSHIWSPNYYVGSVGNTTEAIVKKYIETQKERPFKASFRKMMEYIYQDDGHLLLEVDSYDTSKACNKCGKINEKLKVGEKEWNCPNCGQVLDRDFNASLNIRDWAQDITKHPKHGKSINGHKVKDSELLLTF